MCLTDYFLFLYSNSEKKVEENCHGSSTSKYLYLKQTTVPSVKSSICKKDLFSPLDILLALFA